VRELREKGVRPEVLPDLSAKAASETERSAAPAREATQPAACASCGAAMRPNAKFCPKCGKKVEAEPRCASCGAELRPGAKFCPKCGKKVEAEPRCASCGAELRPGAKFCPKCGKKVE
jgi:predicted RNA-binding Zn-ribbon protein involved in translation (DUF1610 family)